MHHASGTEIGVERGRCVSAEERAPDPQRNDVYTPSSGDKTTRIIDFTVTMRQLKCVVGDAANANFHAEEKGKPCSTRQQLKENQLTWS